MPKRDTSGLKRYVKAGDPTQYRYFTEQSVKLYPPERSGWVPEDSPDVPAPSDVVNFMEARPIDVKAGTEGKTCNSAEDVTSKVLQEQIDQLTATNVQLSERIKELSSDEYIISRYQEIQDGIKEQLDEAIDSSSPETEKKDKPEKAEKPVELRDFSTLATRKLKEQIAELTGDELLEIVKSDKRVTAKQIATDEIQKREKA